jgi:hypothetical protein
LGIEAAQAAEKLRYFVDPHNKTNDRSPEIGFNDDLEVFRKGTNSKPGAPGILEAPDRQMVGRGGLEPPTR